MSVERVRIALVQINNSFAGQEYFPYSVGLLQAYVRRHASNPARYEFMLPVFRRMAAEDAVEQLLGADIVGFSTYVWNFQLSLEIARRIKARRPDTWIVFGGPHVPDRAGDFLRNHGFVDLCCHGEGEPAFLKIVETYPSRRWDELVSVSYLGDNGNVMTTPRARPTLDLDTIPSPYLEGVFDPLMAAYPGQKWIALWETNRGCPFSCSFCYWGSSAKGKLGRFKMSRLQQEMEWFADHKIEFVFCCDANFGILPRDVEIARMVAETKRRRGYPHALSVQSTKNATERAYQVQKILSAAGLNKGVTISLQSLHPTALANVRRANISLETYRRLQQRFTQEGVETYTDLILGLPGETYESFAEGVSRTIEEGQHNRIQFNNLCVLPNTELSDPAYRRMHGIQTSWSRVVNIHGAFVVADGELAEMQELVVATATMPAEDWVRARAFGWWTALLHFDKLLQIPFVVLHAVGRLTYRELLEAFSENRNERFKLLSTVGQFFRDKAREIQNGGEEYVHAPQWLNIWWPADEYIFIKLSVEKLLPRFYKEAQALLERLVEKKSAVLPPALLNEAVALNHALLKQPFQNEDAEIPLTYNLWDFYVGVVRGRPVALKTEPAVLRVDRTSQRWSNWDDWCREVVWYGNKKGAYLYAPAQAHAPLETVAKA
ncbi:MAG: radical SAM protein [Verrucomicrobiae bacterium]|nr:radical SAM protein [Verrucomicrobiae bacterium]